MSVKPVRLWEPSLPEALADPIVQAVMSSDGVAPEELTVLIDFASSRLGGREARAIARRGWSRCPAHRQREPARERLGR